MSESPSKPPARPHEVAGRRVHASLLEAMSASKPLTEAGEDFMFLYAFAGHACREGLESIAEMPHYDLGRAYRIVSRRFPDSGLATTLTRLLRAADCTPDSFSAKAQSALEDDHIRIVLASSLYGASAMIDPPIWSQIWDQLDHWASDSPNEILSDSPQR